MQLYLRQFVLSKKKPFFKTVFVLRYIGNAFKNCSEMRSECLCAWIFLSQQGKTNKYL